MVPSRVMGCFCIALNAHFQARAHTLIWDWNREPFLSLQLCELESAGGTSMRMRLTWGNLWQQNETRAEKHLSVCKSSSPVFPAESSNLLVIQETKIYAR